MTTVINKGQIGEQDIYRFDGSGTNTFTRDTSTGATLTLNKIGYEVNALTAYGGGVLLTNATVTACLTAIGTTTKATVFLAPGTWTFSSNVDYSSYTNITFKLPPGAIISHGSYTLNIPNIEAGLYQIFTGAGAVTISGNVKEAYPEWWATNTTPGTTDMSDAIQAALAAHPITKLSATTYLVTETLTILTGHSIIGENKYPTTTLQSGVSQAPLTKIVFDPASELDLFDITTVGAYTYVTKVYIAGIHCIGNTTGGVTYSKYGINSKAAQSVFENLGFEQFQDGIYCAFDMTNKYRNIYLGNMSHAGIYTSTLSSTSDIFDNVIMRESPWGAIIRKVYHFVFRNCLFETLSVGGVNIYKECWGIDFINNYSENVPVGADGTDYGMFYINHNGTTLGGGTVSIIGGFYTGSTSGDYYGSFVDVGKTNYYNHVSLIGVYYGSFYNGIKADTTDTDYSSILVSNIDFVSVTNDFVNATKLNRPVITGLLTQGGAGLQYLDTWKATSNSLILKDVDNVGSATIKGKSSTALADNGTIAIASHTTGANGLILVTMNDGDSIHEAGLFSVAFVSGAASVVKVVGTSNTAITDSDGNLCVYPSTTSVIVKNALGAAVYAKVLRIY